jgi:hypothetical protein
VQGVEHPQHSPEHRDAESDPLTQFKIHASHPATQSTQPQS